MTHWDDMPCLNKFLAILIHSMSMVHLLFEFPKTPAISHPPMTNIKICHDSSFTSPLSIKGTIFCTRLVGFLKLMLIPWTNIYCTILKRIKKIIENPKWKCKAAPMIIFWVHLSTNLHNLSLCWHEIGRRDVDDFNVIGNFGKNLTGLRSFIW